MRRRADMTEPTATGSRESAPSGADVVRLARAVLPVAAAGAATSRGVLDTLGRLVRMYSDPRYLVSPLGRVGPVALGAAAVANYFFWTYLLPLPLLAPLVERAVLIGLAAALYAVLSREVARYAKVLDYLAKYG
jgi:hypothetical protein